MSRRPRAARPYHIRLWVTRRGETRLEGVKSAHQTSDLARRVARLYRDTQNAVVGWRIIHAPTGTLVEEKGAP